jgi:ribosomal protein S18 acetylase RimI-like enzyme
MELALRAYQNEDDYWQIREFLRDVFLLNERRELSWQVYRFDHWRWHGVENLGHGRLQEDVFIWETTDSRIAAVLNREGPGEVYLQVNPKLRRPGLEEEMIAVAEKHLAIPGPHGKRKLRIWTNEFDLMRKDILTRRGYTKSDWPEFQRRRPMSLPVPDVPVAKGFTVRALGNVEELTARTLVSWKAFHPDEPAEHYKGWEWYRNLQRAPLYRRDLDIVAVAPEGDFASFCTVWFDDVTRTGAFEPVGTAPEHQRRGLGKAVMCAGLRQLNRLGATMAYVGSYETAAHALYASVGFTEYDLLEPWAKEL